MYYIMQLYSITSLILITLLSFMQTYTNKLIIMLL